ncbi:MAG: hypothetical protein AAF716_11400 [Cyanobacteria bacterium P01_D01_bin.1]
MTDTWQTRLDRVDATLDRVGERLDSIAVQQAKNTDDIDTLLGAVSSNEVACRELRISIVENQERFTVLREEAQADRAETRRLSDEAQADRAETRRLSDEATARAERDRAEFRAYFNTLREEAQADRAETRRLSDEAQADRAETRRLSDEATARAERDRAEARAHFDQLQREAAEDRRRADERHAAQMEVIQTLLLELTETNRNVTDLRDRVDLIDQAAG